MIYFCGNASNFSTFDTVTPNEISNYFKDHSIIALDTETTGRCPRSKKILSLQLGDSKKQFVIDTRTVNINHFKSLIEEKQCIAHNAKFDYKFLLNAGIYMRDIYDTMLAEVVIFNGFDRGYGLDDLCMNHLGIELPKDTRGEFHKVRDEPFTDKQIEYAGRDVEYLHKIRLKQIYYIKQYELQYAVKLENRAVKSFADMEYNGVYLDTNQWKKLATTVKQRKEAQIKKMDNYLINKGYFRPSGEMDLFGIELRQINVNYDSNAQMLKFLKNQRNIDIEGTEERTLKKHKNDEFVNLLLEFRTISKQESTYGESFLNYVNDHTKRVHTDFWQVKHTFRVGSGSKKTNAPNMQNIPSKVPEFRACFKPRKGFKWLAIDYASQELRLMGDFSGEKKFIDALNNGEDLHCFAYNEMTGESITKKEKEKRTKAKTINFGKPYGMSPFKLSDELNIDIEEAKELFRKYAEAFPHLNKWLNERARFGKNTGYIITNNRHKGRRWFPEHKAYLAGDFKKKGIIERQSMNTPIQGE